MRTALFLPVILSLSASLAMAQTGLMPIPKQQFFDNVGRPLAGGKLYSYVAGTSTPQDTYTDSGGTSANTDPIILDAGGRASVWLLSTELYKFVLTDSLGSLLWTADNVAAGGSTSGGTGGGGGGGGANPAFTGTATFENIAVSGISNLMGGGPAVRVAQTGADGSGKGGYLNLAPITYPNTTCLDSYGNPVNQPIPATGYSTFGPNDAVLWVSESPLAGVSPANCARAFTPNETYGLNLNMYMFAMGGFSTNQTSYNSFDSLAGGMHAMSFSANNYVNVGHHAGTPPLTTYDSFNAGALFYNDTAGCMQVYNGSSWACLGSGGGGGGGGGASGSLYSIQSANPAGTLYGDANFIYVPASGIVTLAGNGYFHSSGVDGGFNASASAHTDAIQALYGGVTAKWLITTDSVLWTEEGVPAVSGAGQARIYMDSSSHSLMISQNQGAYTSFGGGSGSPGGSNTNVQFNTSSSFGGSANFTWNNSSQLLNVTATSSAAAGISVSAGFIQSAAGFVSDNCIQYNCVQVVNLGGSLAGGMAALSFTAQSYIQTGSSSGAPTPTTADTFHAGAMYWDTGTSSEQV